MNYRFLIKLSLTLLLLFLLSIGGFSYWLEEWSQRPIVLDEQRTVSLPAKTPLRQLSHALLSQGIVNSDFFFSLWIKWKRYYPRFQAGPYAFIGSVSPQDIADKMMRGEIYNPLILELTIPEGYTITQINQKIEAILNIPFETLEGLSRDKNFIHSLGVQEDSLEGYTYPATYHFFQKKPQPEQVYKEMVGEFFKRLPPNYIQDLKNKGLSLHQAVIFASLIERESSKSEEYSKISEVIWNRLHAKMPLAIDASLIYGIKDYKGNLTKAHLMDPSNPYNTRIHPGLPPGPIASCSLEALLAVLTPTNEGYYYYVLLSGEGKAHHFSKNLKEHNHYVKKLIQSQREAR